MSRTNEETLRMVNLIEQTAKKFIAAQEAGLRAADLHCKCPSCDNPGCIVRRHAYEGSTTNGRGQ